MSAQVTTGRRLGSLPDREEALGNTVERAGFDGTKLC